MSHIDSLTDSGNFRAKVQAILGDLEARGESPAIGSSLRTKEQQRELVRKGYSKTLRSKHLPGHDGKAKAADIVDAETGWGASRRFWFLLGADATARGLRWGGFFGLSREQSDALMRAFDVLRAADWPNLHEAYRAKMGWDPAHVELP